MARYAGPSVAASNGAPVASTSTVTCTPHGAAALAGGRPGRARRPRGPPRAGCAGSAAPPPSGRWPRPSRRPAGSRCPGWSPPAAPRACPTRCRRRAARRRRARRRPRRNCSGGYGAPDQLPGVVQPRDRGVALVVTQRGQHRHQGGEGVGSGAAEHPGVDLRGARLDGHDHVDHAAQADGGRRVADGGVAGVADQDRVGAQQVGVGGDEGLEAAGALLLGSLDDQLQVDRDARPRGRAARPGA